MELHYRFARSRGFFGGRDKWLNMHRLQHWQRRTSKLCLLYLPSPVRREGHMQTVKQSSKRMKTFESSTIQLNIRIVGDIERSDDVLPRQKSSWEPSRDVPVLRSFEESQPMRFSERFPRLTCFLITCGIFAAALVTEIECLRGAGYFWR